MTPVLAATAWPENGDLIADCAQLGYLKREWVTLDPTFERGVFWKRWRPDVLVSGDFNRALPVNFHADFRELPFPDSTFDAVVFDPPYVCVGGRATTTLPDLYTRYGLTGAPTSPLRLLEMNWAGLAEVVRVTKPYGMVLVKYQDQISSGKFFAGTHYMAEEALRLGCEYVDRLERTQPNPRPQPKRARQVHARRNLSTLLVFRTSRRKPQKLIGAGQRLATS